MNFFKEEPSLNDILAGLDSDKLHLEQQFFLLLLPDRDLCDFPTWKNKRLLLLKQLEENFSEDIKLFDNSTCQAFKELLEKVEELQSLAFTEDCNLKNQLIENIKTAIPQKYILASDSDITHIDNALNALSNLRCKNYTWAKGIYELHSLQNKYQLESSVFIQPKMLADSQKILETENIKQALLFNMRNNLYACKYALFPYVNDEILFASAFINPDLLENNAPNLFKMVNKRTRLYKEIQKDLVARQYNVFQFTHLSSSNIEVNESSLLHFRLQKLIRVYFLMHSANPTLPLYPSIETHLRRIWAVSSETDLLNPKINRKYSSNFCKMLDQLGITQSDVANILGVSDSYISQELNKSKPSNNLLLKIADLYKCSLSFLQEKTTIPSYGKLATDKSGKYSLAFAAKRLIGRNFLTIFQESINKNHEHHCKLYKLDPSIIHNTLEDIDIERFNAITEHISILRKKYETFSVEKLKALSILLK